MSGLQTPQPMVRVRHLSKSYVQGRVWSRQKFAVAALEDVNLEVAAGSTVALVGESGSGKSTLARCLARLEEPSTGEIWFDGQNLLTLAGDALFQVRNRLQLIFQDTATALNPRFSAGEIIAEPLAVQREGTPAERRRRGLELLEQVGLPNSWLDRRPR